ncbi:MAG: DUF1223 domain-containing protein [Thiohalophilus sp.]|jgi:hypothetical protein
MKPFRITTLLLILTSSRTLFAGDIQFQSGEEQNQLIELYTSEGCSSCPPAERWLNSLRDNPTLWQDQIPVAFHVDYWNKLGWKDRFSSPAYSARQRAYARHWRARTVYTPEFVVNGQEWRGWHGAGVPDNAARNVGELTVLLKGEALTASFEPQITLPDSLVLHVARLGMDRTTQIRAGEREGEKTTHHFVVLEHKSINSDSHQWQTRIPLSQDDKEGKQALAVWVTRQNDPTPIQSTGGTLSR